MPATPVLQMVVQKKVYLSHVLNEANDSLGYHKSLGKNVWLAARAEVLEVIGAT